MWGLDYIIPWPYVFHLIQHGVYGAGLRHVSFDPVSGLGVFRCSALCLKQALKATLECNYGDLGLRIIRTCGNEQNAIRVVDKIKNKLKKKRHL